MVIARTFNLDGTNSFNAGANNSTGRQAILNYISTAFTSIGEIGSNSIWNILEFDSYVVDALNDAKVFRLNLSPSGVQYLRVATSSSSNYTITVTSFESWDPIAHTGSNQGTAASFTLIGAAQAGVPVTAVGLGLSGLRGVNLYTNGVYNGRIGFYSPALLSAGWAGRNHFLVMDVSNVNIGGFYSRNSPAGTGVTRGNFLNSLNMTVPNALTLRPNILPGLVNFLDTTGGISFGPLSTDIAICAGSSLCPLGATTADGQWYVFAVNTNYGIAVRIAA